MHLRETLRKALSRSQDDSLNISRTSADSHTSYGKLTSAEKETRMKNLHEAVSSLKSKIRSLERKVAQLINKYGVHLEDEDAEDVSQLMKEVDPIVKSDFSPDSAQRIFWDQQLHYNSLKDKRQMKWHPLVLRFALNIKYKSTAAYKALHYSGIVHLPSERTLIDYTHWTEPKTGLSIAFVEQLKKRFTDELPHGQHHCALLLDEIKIKRVWCITNTVAHWLALLIWVLLTVICRMQ